MKVVRKKLDLCKAVKDLVQDGVDQEMEQGKVMGAIMVYHNEGLTEEEIVKKVRSLFKLTSKQVKDYMKKAIVTA